MINVNPEVVLKVTSSGNSCVMTLAPEYMRVFGIEKGDRVIFEIKDIIKANQIATGDVVGKVSAGQKASYDVSRKSTDEGVRMAGFEPLSFEFFGLVPGSIAHCAVEDVMKFR